MTLRCSVLVVDDNADSRDMLAEYLSFMGFDVSTASDGLDAIARVEQRRPDVVLMDLALPGAVDGWEATRRLKANPGTKDTVVIAVTAHAFPEQHQKALQVGCARVFSKPVDLAALTTEIAAVAGTTRRVS